MTILECANCGTQKLETGMPCSNCGSEDEQTLLSVLDTLTIREQVTFTFQTRHKMWPYLIKSIRFNLSGAMTETDRELVKGLCYTAITFSAFLVEAVITDHMKEEWEYWLFDQSKKEAYQANLEQVIRKPWRKKKKLAAELRWDLEGLAGFEGVEMLFDMRDHLGHGLSYDMRDERVYDGDGYGRQEAIQILNKIYDAVYRRMSELNLLPPIEDYKQITVEPFLVPNVARWLFDNAVVFLRDFFEKVNLSSPQNLRPEFERAFGEVEIK